ncbi:MAG: HAMP domain-containing histidine kinase [Lachnospiraceae bacterium]|nr:HAMP domain-containing histidine kinase [Lachnospiraceae bacterium]
MSRSLNAKTAFTFIISGLLTYLICISLCFTFANSFYTNVKQREMLKVYDSISSLYENDDETDHSVTLSSICEENTITLLIRNPAGKVIFAYGNLILLSESLDEVLFGQSKQFKTIAQTDHFTVIQSFNDKNEADYLIMWGFIDNGNAFIARSSFSGLRNNINAILTFFCYVCAILIIFSSILMILVTRRFVKPIRNLATVVQKANEGDYDIKYETKSKYKDELGIIGDNIYELSQKLEKTISELKSTNLNLKNELKAKTELEEARKKYMSDVSHELKTPIALISGYAEGLKEGISDSPEDREYYCDVIIDEAEKMNLLVKRLATLNQLEQGAGEVNLERFNIVEVIDGFLNTMSIVIDEHKAKIYFNNKNTVYVWTDEFLFEEVLVNYFNNALNHLDDKKIIRINVEQIQENVRVTVFNSGEKIPDEEMEKLWGKFYKVDKARTRAYGGSGLGLSIVKAIADSLERECGVYNTDEGVAFWIDLEAASAAQPSDPDKKTKPDKVARVKLTDLPIWKSTTNVFNNRRKKDASDK